MIIHVGYPKTGSTFLQENIYPHLKGVTYYDYEHCRKLFRLLINHNSIDFDAETFKQHFNQQSNDFYSFEVLVGKLANGEYNIELAHRLKALGFKQIIISLRNQQSIFESLYRQYIQQGGVLKAKDFFREEMREFRWSYLDYYPLVQYYANLFGKENVFIFLQEELRNNQTKVLNNFTDFIGAAKLNKLPPSKKKGNKSLSSAAIKLLRVLNHSTNNYYRPSNLISSKITTWKFRYLLQEWGDPLLISKIFSNKPLVPKNISQQIPKRYRDNNLKLQETYHLNLKQYHYPLPN